MTEASRVQALLIAQNAEIDQLKNRIAQLEDANLKQSCIKVDDDARIAQLEDALKELLSLGQWGMNDLARTVAREALGGHVKETAKV